MFSFLKKNKIKSDVINDIKYNKINEEYEGKTFIGTFNQQFNVNFTTTIDYAEKCVATLNNKELFDELCNAIVNLCNEEVKDYLDNEKYAALYKLSKEQILSHIYELSILINESRNNSIGYCITGSCDWNEEHGFIAVIRDNKIIHIGENDNIYSPWDN